MTIAAPRRHGRASLGGSIVLPPNPCRHGPARHVSPWTGEPGHGRDRGGRRRRQDGPAARRASSPPTAGTVIAVDIDPARRRRRSTTGSRTSARSRGWPSWCARPTPPAACARRSTARPPRARPTWSCSSCRSCSTTSSRPDHRWMDAAVEAIAPGRPRGLDGHLRDDAAGRRHARAGTRRALEAAAASADGATGLLRGLLAGAAVQRRRACATWRRIRSSSAGSARPRPPAPPRSTRRARRRGRGDELGRGRRVREARRHDLSRRQHRPGQRVRRVRRPDRRGHHRGHRGRQQPAVQPHPPAGHRRRRPLHPGLPALPPRPGPGARARRRVAGEVNDGQVERGDPQRSSWRSGASTASTVLVLGLTYRARGQGAGLLAGAAADRAAGARRRPRPRLRPAARPPTRSPGPAPRRGPGASRRPTSARS